MIFNIGDRVKGKDYEHLPNHMKNPGVARLCDKGAIVSDRLYSEAKGAYIYKLTIDGYDVASSVAFPEDALETALKPALYEHEFEYLENLVIVRFYQIVDGEKMEISRGHGHIFHEGAYGVAQAASYALKRIAQNMNGGSFKKGGAGT